MELIVFFTACFLNSNTKVCEEKNIPSITQDVAPNFCIQKAQITVASWVQREFENTGKMWSIEKFGCKYKTSS